MVVQQHLRVIHWGEPEGRDAQSSNIPAVSGSREDPSFYFQTPVKNKAVKPVT